MHKAANFYSPSEMELLLEQFTPLVKATAWRYRTYKKYGVEKDDLIQEGYLALTRLIPQCEDRKYLASFLKDRLCAYVWAAAERLRQKWGEDGKEIIGTLDDETEHYIPDETSGEELHMFELDDMCARVLPKRHLKITRLLLKGYTRREIAEELNISHQAVNSIIAKIKKKLAPHLEACRNEGENMGAERLLLFWGGTSHSESWETAPRAVTAKYAALTTKPISEVIQKTEKQRFTWQRQYMPTRTALRVVARSRRRRGNPGLKPAAPPKKRLATTAWAAYGLCFDVHLCAIILLYPPAGRGERTTALPAEQKSLCF